MIYFLGVMALWGGWALTMVFPLGDALRLGRRKTAIILGIVVLFFTIYQYTPGWRSFAIDFADCVMTTFLGMLLIRRELIGNLTLLGMYLDIANLTASVYIGGVYALVSTLQGNLEWLVVSESGTFGRMLVPSGTILAMPVGLRLIYWLKPIVLSMSRRMQIVVFLLCEGVRLINNFVKGMGGGLDEYHNDPSGVYMLLDSALAICFLIGFFITVLWGMRNERLTRRRIKEQIDAAYSDYGEITALRQEIRGLNHDMRNLKAETPQKG